MIFDTKLILAEAQAITATAISENVIQWGAMGSTFTGDALRRDIGDGNKVPLLVQVVDDFNNLTSMDITLEQATNAALSTGADVLWSHNMLLADLVEGAQVPIVVLPKDITKEYLGLRFTVNGTAPTTGKVTAGVTHGVGTVSGPLA